MFRGTYTLESSKSQSGLLAIAKTLATPLLVWLDQTFPYRNSAVLLTTLVTSAAVAVLAGVV